MRASRLFVVLALLTGATIAVPSAHAQTDPCSQPGAILGTEGDDFLEGSAGDVDDIICGLGGNDVIWGYEGEDRLDGGAGNDILGGGPGDDIILGGDGDDFIDQSLMTTQPDGADDIGGGAGQDAVTYRFRLEPVSVTFDDSANDGEPLEGDNVHADVEVAEDEPFEEVVEMTPADSGVITTDKFGDGAEPRDVTESTLTASADSPFAYVADRPTTLYLASNSPQPPSGTVFVGQPVETRVDGGGSPLPYGVMVVVDGSLVPSGGPDEVDLYFAQGFGTTSTTLVPDCTGAGTPDPCIVSRTTSGDDLVFDVDSTINDVQVTWSVGVPAPPPPPPPPPPAPSPTPTPTPTDQPPPGGSDITTATVPPGGTVTTDPTGDGATPTDPIETSVTSPNGGTVTIEETETVDPSAPGFAFLGQQINITAPDATDPASPLVLVFTLDASIISEGATADSIEVFRAGVLLPDCPGATALTESLQRCVSGRQVLADGDIQLTVLTMQASPWNLGVSTRRSRTVTLELRRHLFAVGRVSSAAEPCVAGVPVTIQRRRGGRWVAVARSGTGPNGRYRTLLVDRSGRYRTVLPRVVTNGLRCSKATSPAVRHRH